MYSTEIKSLLPSGLVRLLAIKDIDIRLSNLEQCRKAVDGAIHIGGAFSATIPLVSLFYGGFMDLNIAQPTTIGQDLFVLSKGHAVATLASIYADLGYFDKTILANSRSISSALNGHPGPLLPGVHVATGPMGQGLGVAQGFAIAGKKEPRFDVYALTGDGELQEGPIWESIMFAGQERLENLCVLVDCNGGQLDQADTLHFPYHDLSGSFSSFGWRVLEIDATQYSHVYEALSVFKHGPRDGKPTAILCRSYKGYGGFSSAMNQHKASIPGPLLDQECLLQQKTREARVQQFCQYMNKLLAGPSASIAHDLARHADAIGFQLIWKEDKIEGLTEMPRPVGTQKAPVRNKEIYYQADQLPRFEKGKTYSMHIVVETAMKILAVDDKIVSIDADLASTSGLQAGVSYVDQTRAFNVGVAEANMMLIGEAFSILGANVWISTFCPFYDWKVLRRIAVGHQERLEIIEKEGWLSKGHALDLTLLATAADLETQSNGATHMGNDDALLFNAMAHVDIINASCPQQLLGIMRWIVEGNRGIIYLRMLRAPVAVIYDADFSFRFGEAYEVFKNVNPSAYVICSGRAVHETLAAAQALASMGVALTVIDMPSIDEKKILSCYEQKKPIFIVEQNNGYIWDHVRRILFNQQSTIDTNQFIPINTGTRNPHYIHSGTYAELAHFYGLDAVSLKNKISETLKNY